MGGAYLATILEKISDLAVSKESCVILYNENNLL